MQIEIEEIRRIEFRPGDRLVLRAKGRLSDGQVRNLMDGFAKFAPGVPVLVLDETVSLEVLSEVAP